MTDGGKLVSQSLLDEHGGNLAAAYADLSERFARIALDLDAAERNGPGRGWGRMAPPTTGTLDDVPAAVDDTWITTGREA